MIRWVSRALLRSGNWLDEWCDRRARRKSNDDKIECCSDEPESSSNLRSSYSLVGGVKWKLEHANIGRLLKQDGELTFYTHEFHYVEVAMFTAHVFAAQTGRNVNDIGCVYKTIMSPPKTRHDDEEYAYTQGRLMFDKETYEAFKEWFDEYKKRFPEGFEFKKLLPEVRDGEQVTGYFVDHNCDYSPRRTYAEHEGQFLNLPDDELFDEWLWMLNNTTGVVRILDSKWVFEDSSDAMMYQLQLR